ncbi:rRNA maturation RNase YbeY [Vampirovibrio sp.]|uniref:rRNA maturation RNase YbeY n=1 Tax=Vampirovibrio sp. TaxID=2717857 RepID=UPI003593E99A
MTELSFSQNHITTLSLPFLCLEIFAEERIPVPQVNELSLLLSKAWPFFLQVAEQHRIYDNLTLDLKDKVLEVELTWTNNATMQTLNEQYRQKEGPTDVLTFTLLAEALDPALWVSLPVLQLGSIFISLEYAQNAVQATPELSLNDYLLERFIHGMLHLLGMHHDTMEKFEKVVAIQNEVRILTTP